MASGLQTLFGLDDPQREFPNDQSKQFSEDFKREMKAAADAMAYTAQNADEQVHAGLVSRGEAAYGDYQDTQKKIEAGGDEAQIKKEIKKVLEAVKALAGDAGKLKAETEAAKQAWDALAGEKSKADGQIDELDAWDHKNAAKLLQVRQKIDGDAGARRWAVATKTLEALLPKLGPLYEDYLKQKQAKEDYDKERPALDQDFQAADGYPEATPKIEEMTGQAGAKLDEAAGKAEEKDYVAALEIIRGQQDPLAKLSEAIEAHKKLKQDFLNAKAKVLPPAEAAAKEVPKSLEADFAPITALMGEVEKSAGIFDYETGLTQLTDLGSQHKEHDAKYQAYLEQKKDYEDGLKELAPQLEAVSEAVESQTIQAQQAQIAEKEAAMKQAAEADDYGTALEQMKPLQSEVPACQTAIDKYKEQKAVYEERLSKAAPRLETAKEPVKNELLASGQSKIAEIAGEMTAAAEIGDYETALAQMDRLEPVLDGFEQHKADVEKEREEYAKRKADVDKRLSEIGETPEAQHLADEHGIIVDLVGKIEAAAEVDDFDTALGQMDSLEAQLTGYETLLAKYKEQKAAYEERLAKAEPRLEKAKEEVKNTLLVSGQSKIAEIAGEAAAGAEIGDYETALAQMDRLEPVLDGFEQHKADVEKEREEYAKRKADVDKRLSEIGETPEAQHLTDEHGIIVDLVGKIEAAAEVDDFDTALGQMDSLEAQLTGYEALLAKYKEQKAAYEDRLAKAEPRLETAKEEVKNAMLLSGQAKIAEIAGEAAATAEIGDYETALAQMDRLEPTLDGFEQNKADVEKEREEYAKRKADLDKRLSDLGETPEAQHLADEHGIIVDLVGKIEAAAEVDDFDTALGQMDSLEAQLAGYEALLAKYKEQKAAYEDRLAKAEPRLAAAEEEVKNTMLVSGQSKIAEIAGEAAAGAEIGDYETALAQMDRLEPVLDGFEQHKADVEKEREEYAKRKADLDKRLSDLGETPEAQHLADEHGIIVDLVGKIEAAAEVDDFDTALGQMDSLEAQLAGYEALLAKYKEQKAAYEDRLAKAEPRLAAAEEEVKNTMLVSGQSKIAEIAGEAAAGAEIGDYETALAQMDRLEPVLDGFEQHKADVEKEREEYAKRKADLDKRLSDLGETPEAQHLTDEHGIIVDLVGKIEAAAEVDDFDTALGQMDSLEAQLAGYEALLAKYKEQKAAYEDRLAKAEPRLAAAEEEVKNTMLVSGQSKIAEIAGEAAAGAEIGDYETALAQMDRLEPVLDGFEQHKADVEKEREEYAKRKADVDKRLSEIGETPEAQHLADEHGIIVDLVGKIEAAAEVDDFDTALGQMDSLEAQLTGYEALLAKYREQKKAYEERLAKVADLLKKVADQPAGYDVLKPVQDKIVAERGKMDKAAEAGDFDAALQCLDWLEPALDGYEEAQAEMAEAQQAYEKRLPDLTPRVRKLSEASLGTAVQKQQEAIAAAYGKLEQTAGAGDFEQALANMILLEADVSELEALIEKLAVLKKDYEARLGKVEPRLAKTDIEVKNADLVHAQTMLKANRAEMETAAEAGDYAAASEKMTLLEAQLDAFETRLAKIEEQREEYQTRLKAVNARVEKAKQSGITAGKVGSHIASLDSDLGGVEATAATDDFATALKQMDDFELSLTMCEGGIEKVLEQKRDYEARLSKAEPRLAKTDIEVKNADLVHAQTMLKANRAEMETAAEAGDYAAASEKMTLLEAQLDAFETRLAKIEEQREEYQTRLKAVNARVEKAKQSGITAGKVGSHIASLDSDLGGVEATAATDDFATALKQMDDFELSLTMCEGGIEKVLARKRDYEARLSKAEPRLAKTDIEVKNADLVHAQTMLKANRAEMETAAEAGDYAAALEKMTLLEAQLAAFEIRLAKVEEQRQEYQTRLKAANARIEKAKQSGITAGKVGSHIASLDSDLGGVEATAATDDFATALKQMDDFELSLTMCEGGIEKVLARKRDYEARLSKAEPRLAKTDIEVKNADLVHAQTMLKANRAEMETAAEAGDYDTALKKMTLLEAQLDALETRLAKIEAQRKEYEERLKAANARIEKARQSGITAGKVGKNIAFLDSLQETVMKAGANDDFATALSTMDSLEASLTMCEGDIEKILARKRDYEARLAKAKPRLAKTEIEVRNEDLLYSQTMLKANRAEMEAAAEASDYETASDKMTLLEAQLAAFETRLAKIEAQRKEYEARLKAANARVEKAKQSGITAGKVGSHISSLDSIQETVKNAAANGDFGAALSTMDQLEASLTMTEGEIEKVMEKKRDYETRLGKAKPRLAKTDITVRNEDLVYGQEQLKTNRAEMEAAAGAGDYDTALKKMTLLEAQLGAFETRLAKIEAQRKEYQARLKAAVARVEKAKQSGVTTGPVGRYVAALDRDLEAVKRPAAKDDFAAALKEMDELEVSLTMIEKDIEKALNV